MIAGTLAYIDKLCVLRDHGQNSGAYQCIIDHYICPGKHFLAFQGKKPRITGTCSDQPDFSDRHLLLFFPVILTKLDGKISSKRFRPLRISFYRSFFITAGFLIIVKSHKEQFAILHPCMGRYR